MRDDCGMSRRAHGGRLPDGERRLCGSSLMYDDEGKHELKAIPDQWGLYRRVDP
jgi:hypothetical protein